MRKRGHSAEQIVKQLRTAEIELACGAMLKEACKKLGIRVWSESFPT